MRANTISLVSLLFLAFHLPAANAGETSNWDRQWADCTGFRMPLFQARLPELKKFAQQGNDWDKQLARELAQIEKTDLETCKKWASSPNGEQYLRQFTQEYSSISQNALDLKRNVNERILPLLDRWTTEEAKELAPYGFSFGQFPCGRAFQRSREHVQSALRSLELRLNALAKNCPKAADADIAAFNSGRKEAEAKAQETVSSNARRQGKSHTSDSKVTGIEKAISDDAAAKKLINK